ncbi:Unknown protein [Striga hermonthica]|uniref:Uncharacterized protein n=1 Tax=Striga hermonthica TaxID=68872 RepID=A0A9N7RTG2_STRHE|nr:Unknown protein [Striga hermonthica]
MARNWWGKMMTPMQKVWAKLSKRICSRKNGIIKLHQDVRSCEYEDVHILWDMLKRKEVDLTIEREPFWRLHWSKCSPLLCCAV